MGLGSIIKKIGSTLGRGLNRFIPAVSTGLRKIAPHIATGLGVWNGLKENFKPISNLSKNIGNWLQDQTTVREGDGFLKKLVKGIGGMVNETVFDPSNVSAHNKAPPPGQVSKNSSNAAWSGGEGAVYGTSPNIKNNYSIGHRDFVRTDFENFERRKLPPTIGSSHKFVSGSGPIAARRYVWY